MLVIELTTKRQRAANVMGRGFIKQQAMMQLAHDIVMLDGQILQAEALQEAAWIAYRTAARLGISRPDYATVSGRQVAREITG